VEAILGLVKNCLGVGFEGGFVDLFAAVGGKAMHHEGRRLGHGEQRLVNLITGQMFEPLGGFRFLAHGNPDVRVEEIGARGRGLDIFGTKDLSAAAREKFGRRFQRGGDRFTG